MNDVQFWVYVVFAVIYFVSRSLKKKAQPKRTSSERDENQDQVPPQQPVSFEELLEEITGKKNLKRPLPQPVLETKRRPLDRHEEIEPDIKSFENEGKFRAFSDEESKRVYEESIQRAASYISIAEENTKSKLKREEPTEKSSRIGGEIRSMLRDNQSAKKAVILSEILTRKY